MKQTRSLSEFTDVRSYLTLPYRSLHETSVVEVSDLVRLEPAGSAVQRLVIILKRITKTLIRLLSSQAGLRPLLFTCNKVRFSCVVGLIIIWTLLADINNLCQELFY